MIYLSPYRQKGFEYLLFMSLIYSGPSPQPKSILKIKIIFSCFEMQCNTILENSYNKNQLLAYKMEKTCPKCEQMYSASNPPKKLINCQHMLCLACLSNEILCPIDRKRLERRKYTIEAFQTNHDVLNAIIGVVNQQKPLENYPEDEQMIERTQTVKQENRPSDQQKQITTQPAEAQNNNQGPAQAFQATEQIPPKAEEARFPQYEDINFETCLLHSKTADLICLKDKCLICANCGLFGEHKNHEMLPYDTFVTNYTALIEHSYNNFELLKKSEELLDHQAIEEEVNRAIKEKRQSEVRNVKKVIAGLVQTIKNAEKTLISQLDASLKATKQKLIKETQVSKLQGKVNDYYREIQKLSQGSIDIFKLERIQTYIDYVDENNSKSYINKEGQYLIAEIEGYSKTLRKKINEEVSEIECKCSNKLNEIIANSFELSNSKKENTQTSKKVQELIATNEEKIKIELNGVARKGNEEDLLINSCEKKNIRSMSPIQPIPRFQETFDTTFKNSYKENIITGTGEEFFYRPKELQPSANQLFVPQHKKAISSIAKPNNISIKCSEGKKEQCANQNKVSGKPTSNNSSHIVEREILSALNENKKKKKLELPEKYSKIYDDLHKDKLDVLDFGGAYLGDQVVLSISELFESRTKLKSAKLMNNKISDEIFPDLLFRCRNLCSINLSYNNLTEKSLEWLERQAEYLGNLTNITISNNKIVLRNVKDRIENLRKKGVKVSL